MTTKSLPEKIKEFLGPIEKLSLIERIVTPNNSRQITTELLLRQIQPYYDNLDIEATEGIFKFILEPIKNINYYVNTTKENPLRLKVFMTPQALVTSQQSIGIYLARLKIKEVYENRISLTEKDPEREISLKFTYKLSDLIHVETSTGTLFLGLKVPENDLFYKSNLL